MTFASTPSDERGCLNKMQEILFESACPYVGCINNNKTYTWKHYN